MSHADGSPAVGPAACPRRVHPAPTSIAGFLGTTSRGATDRPALVDSLRDFTDGYGPITSAHPLTRSVELFFHNGGARAAICRVEPESGRLDETHLIDPSLEPRRAGLWMFERLDAVNLLCIAPFDAEREVTAPTWRAAAAYARARGAMLLIDAPRTGYVSDDERSQMIATLVPDAEARINCALYTPWLRPEPLPDGTGDAVLPPSGAVAGLYARIDAARGVWAAPAGREASIRGLAGLHSVGAIDGYAAPGVNVIRYVDGTSDPVLWGARTLAAPASEWTYVPVRRLALYVEQTLHRSLAWAVFEPNDERLWEAVRLLATTFMSDLLRDGALQGRTEREAFFVRCDRTTTTQDDIANGRLTIEVGMAPLRPAEFIVLRIGIRTRRPA